MKQTCIHDYEVPGSTLIQRHHNVNNALPHFYDRHANAICEKRVRANIVGADPDDIHSFVGENTGGRDGAVVYSIEIVRELVLLDRGEGTGNEIIGTGGARLGKAYTGPSAIYISMARAVIAYHTV